MARARPTMTRCRWPTGEPAKDAGCIAIRVKRHRAVARYVGAPLSSGLGRPAAAGAGAAKGACRSGKSMAQPKACPQQDLSVTDTFTQRPVSMARAGWSGSTGPEPAGWCWWPAARRFADRTPPAPWPIRCARWPGKRPGCGYRPWRACCGRCSRSGRTACHPPPSPARTRPRPGATRSKGLQSAGMVDRCDRRVCPAAGTGLRRRLRERGQQFAFSAWA